ncbi:uncharacterized protein LOC133301892 [Gastrolobium bilobum]|uniref:uncharacterized protein LOC133301892 n=1 Tax=Gastrolobium bilobum TaxID=150636 RepID=UPI002AB1D89B|nr:uncharacterized protein LOC133301892 [Gastrolobium bilobum]
MAMGPERSKPLHNFSLPCLKWGTQKLLRCVNAEPCSLDRRSSKSDEPHMNQNEPCRVPKRKNDNNIDAVREKIMGDLRVAAKKLKVSIFENGKDEGGGAVAATNARPWNLRTRRAACKEPPQPQPPHEEERRFFYVGSSSPVKEKKKMMMINEKAKFSVSLSKEEVEQDFWALVGTRPPRRPKKRPRIVQRQLNTLFPGLWLAEITAESYKVSDVPE